MTADAAPLAASALHAGFQLVVTVVVYPSLAAVPRAEWPRTHEAHSRRITFVVAPVYLALVAALAWVAATEPWTAPRAVATGGAVVAVLTTAAVAAPTHARLRARGPQPHLMRRLLRADRVRLVAALTGLGGALAL